MRSVRRSDTFDLCQILDHLITILLMFTVVLDWVSFFILGVYWAVSSFFCSVIIKTLVGGIRWTFVVGRSCLRIGSLFEILRVLVKVASSCTRTPWNSPFTLFCIGGPIFVILVFEIVLCLQLRLWSRLMFGHLLLILLWMLKVNRFCLKIRVKCYCFLCFGNGKDLKLFWTKILNMKSI